jgi:hypothetical protein
VIKIIVAGVWACVVALAASYFAVSWQGAGGGGHAAADHAPDKLHGGLETVRTRMISVPIIRSGALQGYVMAQFSFTGDARVMKHLSVKADTVVIDEGFKAIYGDEVVDFRKMKKQDLPDLGKRIVEGANKRLGAHIIEDVFLQELNYVSKEGTRSGGGRGGS